MLAAMKEWLKRILMHSYHLFNCMFVMIKCFEAIIGELFSE